jgi:hypothetical protein
MGLPYIPFLNPATSEKQEGGIEIPPQQQIAPYESMPTQINPAQWNYYQNIQDFTEELKHIKGMLEGKTIKEWSKDGSIWDYPVKILRYIEIANPDEPRAKLLKQRDENGQIVSGYYLEESLIDYDVHIPTGKTYEVPMTIRKPFCNAEGQAYIFNWFSTRLQRGTPNTSYSIERIFYLLRMDARDLQRTVYVKRKAWRVDMSAWAAFLSTIMDRVEAARRRALEGKEFDKTSTQTTVNMSGMPQQQQKQGGLFGNMMPRTRY